MTTLNLTRFSQPAPPPSPVQNYVERILDRHRPADEIVMSDLSRSLTADQLRHEVRGLTAVLADLGLGRGSRLGLLVDNECAALTVRYAANLLGCATVYLPDAGVPAQLATFLRQTAVTAVLVTPGRANCLAAALGAAETLAVTRLSAGPVPSEVLDAIDVFALLPSTVCPPRATAASPGDLGCLVTSGGTTGEPKGSLRTLADWTALVTAPENPSRRQLVCTPLAYVAQVLTDQTLTGGGSVVLRPAGTPFDPAAVLATIEAERISHLCLVEPALVELVDHDDLFRRDLSSLVALTHIGADICSKLRMRLWMRTRAAGLHDVLTHAYGSSETGLVSLLTSLEYTGLLPEALSTAGRLLPGVEVEFMSEFESRCEGELVVRSAGVCRGTTRFPEPSDDPAWVGPRARRTGDWASFDRDGRLVIRGRIDDAVHTGGRVFFPVDVQQALCAHPDVRYAVAVPTRSSAEVPIAFSAAVKLRSGSRTTAHDLSVHLHSINQNLPIAHVHVTAHIPVTEQGKPNRAALDAEFSLLDGLAAMIESSAAHAE